MAPGSRRAHGPYSRCAPRWPGLVLRARATPQRVAAPCLALGRRLPLLHLRTDRQTEIRNLFPFVSVCSRPHGHLHLVVGGHSSVGAGRTRCRLQPRRRHRVPRMWAVSHRPLTRLHRGERAVPLVDEDSSLACRLFNTDADVVREQPFVCREPPFLCEACCLRVVVVLHAIFGILCNRVFRHSLQPCLPSLPHVLSAHIFFRGRG